MFIRRLMYDEPQYAKLAPASFDAWKDVEEESGIKLFHLSGGLVIGKKGTGEPHSVEDFSDAMKESGIEFESLSGAEIRRRFPPICTADDVVGLYQETAGLVDAALGNAVHVQLAQAHGATVLQNCPVVRLEPTKEGGARVYTPKGVFSCRRVVVTAGAWINHVLGSVGVHIPVMVSQEQVTYYGTPHMSKFTKEKFPVVMWYPFYCLPIYANSGYKIGIDCGGPIVSADTRNFNPDPVREKACTDFLKKIIPEAVGPILYTKTCLYTLTKDRDFVVDTLASRGMPQIIFCCGAGHVYKFAALMGKILAELAIDGRTDHDISCFSMKREAISNPNFKPTYPVPVNPEMAKI